MRRATHAAVPARPLRCVNFPPSRGGPPPPPTLPTPLFSPLHTEFSPLCFTYSILEWRDTGGPLRNKSPMADGVFEYRTGVTILSPLNSMSTFRSNETRTIANSSDNYCICADISKRLKDNLHIQTKLPAKTYIETAVETGVQHGGVNV